MVYTSGQRDSGMYILEVAEHFCPLYSNAPLMLQLTTVSGEGETDGELEREKECRGREQTE